ncbi:MAG TPA: OsmC family protein [Longimicrobium sp.]|nr:OsmC family protein [Longimicrobium sp.]
MADKDVVVRNEAGGYRTEVRAGGHTLVADEPASVGGTEQGPTPYDFLLGALGACTAMTARMYAGRKGWPLENVTVRLRQGHSYAQDCADCATQSVAIPMIDREIDFEGPLTDEQRERLYTIAERCPVGQTMAAGIHVRTVRPEPAAEAPGA